MIGGGYTATFLLDKYRKRIQIVKDMKLKDKLTNAILKGINEAFNIADMGNDIATATHKQKVDKQSKMSKELDRFIAKGYDLDDREIHKMMDDDDLEFISMLLCDEQSDDDILSFLYKKRDALREILMDEYVTFMLDSIMEDFNIYDKDDSSIEDHMPERIKMFRNRFINNIKDESDPLYAWYKPAPYGNRWDARGVMSSIIHYTENDTNLNWVDVSDFAPDIFGRIHADGADTTLKLRFWKIIHCLRNNFYMSIHDDWFYDEYMNVVSRDDLFYAAYSIGDDKGALIYLIGTVMKPLHYHYDVNLNWIDVSDMKDLSDLFTFALTDYFNGDISLWDTSDALYMRRMFQKSAFNGDISGWNVGNVLNMSYMFDDCEFDGDISKWNVRNVRDMERMFSYTDFDHDISEWQISPKCSVSGMFEECALRDEYKPKSLSGRLVESFDIGDMGIDISDAPVRKKSVAKNSKIYADI